MIMTKMAMDKAQINMVAPTVMIPIPHVYIGATDAWYDGVDSNCDGANDFDQDGDGESSIDYGGVDCDDTDALINTSATDDDGDGVDDNCDGTPDEGLATTDGDGDGFTPTQGDCDDADPAVYPGAADTWYDGFDSNCDGASDYDQDGDGFDSDQYGGIDCDDMNANISPNTVWYLDNDQDGYGNPSSTTQSCTQPNGYVKTTTTVMMVEAKVIQMLQELCDGLINTCGGSLPADEVDLDGDFYVECAIDSNGWFGHLQFKVDQIVTTVTAPSLLRN